MKNFWSTGTGRTAMVCLLAAAGPVGTAAAQTFYIGEANGNIEVTSGGTATAYANIGSNDTIYGMVTDAANNLYVADETAGNVFEISPGGTQTTIATGLVSPGDVAVDSVGNVYVANSAAGTILQYAATGGAATTYATGLLMPEAITFGANGALYVAEEGTSGTANSGRISVVPAGGGTATAFATGLNQPVALTLNPAGTSLYVGFSGGDTISGFFTTNGAADNKYANLTLTGITCDLTINPDGTLFVATRSAPDPGTNTIFQVSADGTTATTYATANGTVYGFAAAVPEPSSWCILALGTAGLLAAGALRCRRVG